MAIFRIPGKSYHACSSQRCGGLPGGFAVRMEGHITRAGEEYGHRLLGAWLRVDDSRQRGPIPLVAAKRL